MAAAAAVDPSIPVPDVEPPVSSESDVRLAELAWKRSCPAATPKVRDGLEEERAGPVHRFGAARESPARALARKAKPSARAARLLVPEVRRQAAMLRPRDLSRSARPKAGRPEERVAARSEVSVPAATPRPEAELLQASVAGSDQTPKAAVARIAASASLPPPEAAAPLPRVSLLWPRPQSLAALAVPARRSLPSFGHPAGSRRVVASPGLTLGDAYLRPVRRRPGSATSRCPEEATAPRETRDAIGIPHLLQRNSSESFPLFPVLLIYRE
jgi:hypothetical protein